MTDTVLDSEKEQGQVSIALSTDSRTSATSKATTESLPDVDDFTIEIFKVDGNVRLYRDSYANTVGETIYLNIGDYSLLAWYGDSLGVGFDAAHFAATVPFTVEQQQTAQVSATAKLANVKAAVNFGENIIAEYSDYYAVLRARDNENYDLKFEKDETRAGYLPSGSLTFTLYAYDDTDEVWKYYTYEAGTFDPNDFVTFNVDVKEGTGYLDINITIDKETELIEEEVEVPYSMLAKDAPEINDLEATSISVVEGVDAGDYDLRANIVAYGEIASCVLTIDSGYLTALGIPSSVELVGIDDATAALLNEAGITWSSMEGQTLAYVDFSGMPDYIAQQNYVEGSEETSISFTVTDALDKTASSETVTISLIEPSFSYLDPEDSDVWAWKIVAQTVTYNAETLDPDLIVLQYYDEDSAEWVDFTDATDDGNGTITYGTLSGLTAGTGYNFRAVYNGNVTGAITKTITTESADQVGNASMDEWQTLSWTCKYLSSISETYPWWEPWSKDEEDPWWDVNSKISMPSTSWVGSSNIYYRCFPTVGYSIENSAGTSNEGDYSAMIAVVHLGTTNATGSEYTGEMFIGTADDDGAHESDGHSFETRPSKISFDYYYYSKDSETGSVEFKLSASDGTVISTFSDTAISDTDSGWATYTATLDYDYTNLKASEIYMSFKASTDSSPTTSGSTSREFGGTTYTICGGSFLRIDNIKLIYTDPDAE